MKNISKKEKQKITLKYIAKNRLMTLATSINGKPWVAAVFFAYDNKFNLYFFSRSDTKHCKNIKMNSNVAVAINQSWNDNNLIEGIQLQGKAYIVPKSKYNSSYKLYKKRFSWADDFVNDHILYIIKPLAIYHINEKIFGHFFRVRVF